MTAPYLNPDSPPRRKAQQAPEAQASKAQQTSKAQQAPEAQASKAQQAPKGPAAMRETPEAYQPAGQPVAKDHPPHGVRPELHAESRRWGLVTSRFNDEICRALEAGARSCLVAHGAAEDAIVTFHVPGAFEIPGAAKAVLESGRVDAVIGLAAVIRGETPHFEHVSRAVTDGLARLAYESGRPVSYGILTTDDAEQARERAGGARGNKGWEAALAALEMAELLEVLAESPRVGFRTWGSS